ncbi:DUF4785 domain-containing protein [Denitratimonas sp. CY0512]|uniref:DUF4785 domain-containing protein n=1 Tax=Denitratimonas sp. CY0512 TaxID=3131940 RepID=UPI0030AC9ECD
MKNLIFVALSGILFSPALLAAEPHIQLLPASEGDLVASRVTMEKSALAADIERAPVDFAWALDPSQPLSRETPYVADSREFWTTLDAKQLQKGYRFQTTAPGALLRLSPADNAKRTALQLSDLDLRIDGRKLDAMRDISIAVDAAQMKAAGVDFGEGSLVFRLAADAGEGQLQLMAKNAAGDYLLHVYEPDSPVSLTLAADRDRALAGDTITLKTQWNDGSRASRPSSIGGVLTSPQGHSIPIDFTPAKGGEYQATVQLPADAGSGMALWEVHTFAVSNSKNGAIPRDAKTSFSVSRPTARLSGEAVSVQAKSGRVALTLPLEVGAAGRYELRGVLYGTAKGGSMQPFAIAHSARWLEPGKGEGITLDFGDLAAKSGLAAPYELRDLSLNDQARLGLLETRARALRFGADDALR